MPFCAALSAVLAFALTYSSVGQGYIIEGVIWRRSDLVPT